MEDTNEVTRGVSSNGSRICVEKSSSRYCIPVISNRVLIRAGEARIFKTSSETDYDHKSGESVLEAVMYDSECNSDSLVCVLIRDYTKKEQKVGEVTDTENESLKIEEELDWDLSSDDEEVKETDSADSAALPATLKLLEQVSYRILGEKTVTIPEIEKIQEQDESLEKKQSTISKISQKDREHHACDGFREYLDTVAFSEKFVDNILLAAKHEVLSKHAKKVAVVEFKSHSHRKHDFVWPSINDFNIELGVDSIDAYIQHGFALKETWKYKITFLIAQSDKASDFYLFEAKFCLPTACYPVAQATVSVFFTIEVSRVIPKKFPVRVTFTLEGLRTVMVPGEMEVNDKSLLIVLYGKLSVFKQLMF